MDEDSRKTDLQSVRLKNETKKRIKNMNVEVMQSVAEHGEKSNKDNFT